MEIIGAFGPSEYYLMRDCRDYNDVLRTVLSIVTVIRSFPDIGLDAICNTIRSLKRDVCKCAPAKGRQVKTCKEDAQGAKSEGCCMGKGQASKSNSISRLTTAQSQLTNWRSASNANSRVCSHEMRKECLGVRFRATSGSTSIRGRKKKEVGKEREREQGVIRGG